MAIVEKLVCDVYGTAAGVQTYEIVIKGIDGENVLCITRDLGTRALARLDANIMRVCKTDEELAG